MIYSIKHLFHIDAPVSEVFKNLTTLEGLSRWWTVATSGNPKLGGTVKFQFGSHGGPTMEVITIDPNEKVVWECVESTHGWQGHIFIFTLDRNDNKTRVRFSHNGWNQQDDFYALCSFSWGRYMESLRQLCQTGSGAAFGSSGYKG